MANIQNELNNIKPALYGKDVRNSIHDAIKTCYDDASVNNDNANMEVKLARGTHNTLNDRLCEVDEKQNSLSSQLAHNKNCIEDINEIKADKIYTYNKIDIDNKIWSMANMGQDVKEALTGGSVSVVEENSILNENIVTNQITKEKTNFFNYYENLLNPNPAHTDKVWIWSQTYNELTLMNSNGHTCFNPIKLIAGITYSIKDIRGGSLLLSLDLKEKIGEISPNAMFTGTYKPEKDCWLYPFYYTATNMNNIMIVNSSEYWCIGNNKKLEYGKKYKRVIGGVDLDNIIDNIENINNSLPNKLNVESMFSQMKDFIDIKYKMNWVLGSLNNQGGYVSSTNRICISQIEYAETDIFLSTDYTKYRISVYTYNKKENPVITGNSEWITSGEYKIPKGSYFMIQTGGINDEITFTNTYNDCFNSIKFKTTENLIEKIKKDIYKPLLYGLTPSKTRVIMHRGYSNKAPDNSLASFELAGGCEECWGIETDVRVLKDNKIVCFHDSNLDGHTTGTGDILDKSYTDIQNVTYDSGVLGLTQYPNEKIALFSDYLRICKKYGKVAVVEIKPQRTKEDVDHIVKMVNSYGMQNSVMYISFDKVYIDRILEIQPNAVVQKLYLVNDNIDYDNFKYDCIGLEIQDWGRTDINIIESNLRKLQSRGVLVNTWTTDTADAKRSLENKCVDFITTNLIN